MSGARECPACDGMGAFDCENCDGDSLSIGGCPVCDGEDVFVCDTCDGLGVLDDEAWS